MPEDSLQVRLEAIEQRPGHFTLTFGSSQYPIIVNPEASVTFSDWLRRLHPVLTGKKDPAGQLSPQELLRSVGTWLWRALLPESVPAQDRDALAKALRTGRSPLLLTLPETLAGLPWELLCDPEQPRDRGFLARRRPLLRFIPSDTHVSTIWLPLRVLLLISSPPGLKEDSQVDVESERAAVEQATRKAREEGRLHLRVEDIVTPQRVQDALVYFEPHIVHYIGHGEYDAAAGGVLLWEDEQGNELPISDIRLAEMLCPRNLNAVVLHACQTGRRNARTDVQGVAGTLVNEGIPAVLAQQASFTYESSQRASKAWYITLTTKRGFAQALFEVRQALSLADRPDWAVPVLYGGHACLSPVLDATALPGPADPLLKSLITTDLPAPTGVFVGRHNELRALCLMLEHTPGSGPVLALITGPGGVGKSTLAAQAITRYGSDYKYKAELTLRCPGYQGIELFLQRIAEFLTKQHAPDFLKQTLPDPKLSIEAKIEEAVVALNQEGPFLLLVDNLERVQNDDQTLRDPLLLYLLQQLLLNLRGGRVLITGRYAVKDLLPDGKFAAHLLRLDLDDLSPYETSQLLMRHPTLANLGERVREKLIREFGGLPYVYDLLSSDAAGQSLNLLIHDVQGRITEDRKQRSAEEWREIRRQVVEFATLKAVVARLSGPSRTLLAQLGVLYQPFPLAAIEQGLGAKRAVWQPLLDWSLLRYDPLEQTYHLHSLTRRHAEDLLHEQDRIQTQARLASWYAHYSLHESHKLADSLEVHRLLRASGNVRLAGELAMGLAEQIRMSGLYTLMRELCTTTLADIGKHDEQLTASVLYELGNIALLQGDYKEARQLAHQRQEIAKRLGGQREQAITLNQLGNIALLQGDYKEAQRLYQESLEIFRQIGDLRAQTSTLIQLGVIAYDQGDYKEAQRLYQESLEIAGQLENQNERGTALYQLGNIAQIQGDYKEAQRFYQESLEIAERLGDLLGQADTLGQLGRIVMLQGDFPEAQRLFLQSLEIREQLGDQSGRAYMLGNLGMIAQDQGDYKEAQRFYRESLGIAELLGDQSGRASALGHLGQIAHVQRDYEEAQRFYRESLGIAEQLGDPHKRAVALHQLGMIAQDQGDYEEAQRLYNESLGIAEQLGDQLGRAGTLGQLGSLAYKQGDFEKALIYTIQSFVLFTSLQSPSRDDARHNIARICSHLDEATFAILWQKAVDNLSIPAYPEVDKN